MAVAKPTQNITQIEDGVKALRRVHKTGGSTSHELTTNVAQQNDVVDEQCPLGPVGARILQVRIRMFKLVARIRRCQCRFPSCIPLQQNWSPGLAEENGVREFIRNVGLGLLTRARLLPTTTDHRTTVLSRFGNYADSTELPPASMFLASYQPHARLTSWWLSLTRFVESCGHPQEKYFKFLELFTGWTERNGSARSIIQSLFFSMFCPVSDIHSFRGQGNVDLGITGRDVIQNANMTERAAAALRLGFGGVRRDSKYRRRRIQDGGEL
ncbi:hypothetical protein BD410DRAFT_830991, partial [Rickenella mellea]